MSLNDLTDIRNIQKKMIVIMVIFFSVSVWADTPLRISSFKQIPSVETKTMLNLRGDFEHPQICPFDKNIISFELRTESGLKLYWYNITNDSLVEINPPEIKKKGNDIFEEFGISIKNDTLENYDLDWSPVLSPYGEIICVYTHRSGNQRDIYLYYLNENKHVLLTKADRKGGKYNNITPRWSPDGSMIAFMSDRSNDNVIYFLTGMDRFLSFPQEYEPVLYKISGENKVESMGISWNPYARTGMLAFTESIDMKGSGSYLTISFKSLPDSQSVWMRGGSENINTVSPLWDPLHGNKVAYFTYKSETSNKERKIENYNIGICNVFKNDQGKIGINSISDVPINDSPVIIDNYCGPLWLANSNYILYLQKNSDSGVSLQYSDIPAWEKGQKPWNGELLSSEKYKNIRFLSAKKQQVVFVCDINDSSYIIIGKLNGKGAKIPSASEYKLKGNPYYADFVSRISQISKDSFLKKITLKPIGGKDLIINRPIVGLGIGAILILLTNSADNGSTPINVWDDLPEPPNPNK